MIISSRDGSEVNYLMRTFISVTGSGPLNKDEIDEIIDWCDKQETEILLNSSMDYYFRDREELTQIFSEYSIWFEDPDTATYFKMKWA